MSLIGGTSSFRIAHDEGVGDFYHGQSICYYNQKSGCLVKREQRLVCLWSNSGKEFDPEAWKTFQPKYVLWVDDNFNIVPPSSHQNESVDESNSQSVDESNSQSVDESNSQSVDVIDILNRSIKKSPSKKQKLENKVLVKNVTENDQITDKIVESVITSTLDEKKLKEEQSDIQEYYVKEVSKVIDPKTAKSVKQPPKKAPPKKAPPSKKSTPVKGGRRRKSSKK